MLINKDTVFTPRQLALLRALKKRASRIERMVIMRTDKKFSLALIARLHDLSPARLRALFAEYEVMKGEFNLLWRIRNQEVPGTQLPGDKRRYRAYCRASNLHFTGREAPYTGPAKDATLRPFAHRYLLTETYHAQPKLWARL